jgi:CheY-like chemotaxis protein
MKRVLLVDDDRDLAELLAGQLTRAGYDVRWADSLFGALEVAGEETPFDVLVTDLNLPDADGAAVAEALGVPIKLALTGSSSAADSKRLLAAGFAEVLVKPLTGKQLVEALSRSVGSPQGETPKPGG